MTCKDIIIAKLKELGADGLCCEVNQLGDRCACPIDQIYECELCCLNCVPAKIDNDEDSDDEMTIFKPLKQEVN